MATHTSNEPPKKLFFFVYAHTTMATAVSAKFLSLLNLVAHGRTSATLLAAQFFLKQIFFVFFFPYYVLLQTYIHSIMMSSHHTHNNEQMQHILYENLA